MIIIGFNPCFSGCWSSTVRCQSNLLLLVYNVSILVLVDVGLRLRFFAFVVSFEIVSILVLVDVGLRQKQRYQASGEKCGFNPCFSGCWSST